MNANHPGHEAGPDPVHRPPGGPGSQVSGAREVGGLVLKLLFLVVGLSVVLILALAVFVLVMRR